MEIQVLSETHLLAACFRALRDLESGRLKSKNVHSEIVFSMGGGNNVSPYLVASELSLILLGLCLTKNVPFCIHHLTSSHKDRRSLPNIRDPKQHNFPHRHQSLPKPRPHLTLRINLHRTSRTPAKRIHHRPRQSHQRTSHHVNRSRLNRFHRLKPSEDRQPPKNPKDLQTSRPTYETCKIRPRTQSRERPGRATGPEERIEEPRKSRAGSYRVERRDMKR